MVVVVGGLKCHSIKGCSSPCASSKSSGDGPDVAATRSFFGLCFFDDDDDDGVLVPMVIHS